MASNNSDVHEITQEESCVHILCGLISYHERMSVRMVSDLDGNDACEKYASNCPLTVCDDIYLDALKFALACVTEKMEQKAALQNAPIQPC